MRKLALSDEILLSVDKAARYIGGEVNSVEKDKKMWPFVVAFSLPRGCPEHDFLMLPFLNHLVLFAVISCSFYLYHFVLFCVI